MRFEHIHATRIKAHRSNLQATIQGDLQEWVGNAVVDELATEAAAMGAPSKETFTARELDVSNSGLLPFCGQTAQVMGPH